MARLRGPGQRIHSLIRRRREVIGRDAAELGGQLRATGRGQLVGVDAEPQAEGLGGRQNARGLAWSEDARFAEDIAEAGDPLLGYERKLVADDVGDVVVGTGPASAGGPRAGSVAILRRDRVSAQVRRHEFDRPLFVQPPDRTEQAQFRRNVQPVPGLGLGSGGSAGEHVGEAAPRSLQQLLVRRGACRDHG